MNIRKTLPLCLAFSLLTGLAHGGPGWDVTSFAASPQNAPKLVAAIDEWMAGAGGSYPGQVALYANEADGNDPATHTIIATFPSVAANEAYGRQIQGDEKMSAEWAKLMGVFSTSTTVVQTTRGTFVKSWGEADPADSVWMHHMITVSDPGAVVAAFDRWMNSATGKRTPGQVHLSGVVAGGLGSPSHIVSIGYASQAEAERWQEELAGNQDYATFLEAVQQVSEYHGANLAVRVKAWGTSPIAQTASR